MLIKYFYDEQLAQASYLVACPTTGTGLVIDPARDITPYLATASANGITITHVAETHIHADYVSGTRELAMATGATILLSGEGDAIWDYEYPADDPVEFVGEGDTFNIGAVKFDVLHTPGHTPEHICFMITDTATSDRPIGIFTGDALFAGDVGRPDLMETALGKMQTAEVGARQQYANINRFKDMPDYLQVWPGHGAGSACGKALGAIPSTTIGYEKLVNPAFNQTSEATFIDWLLGGQPETPAYFGQMKRVNRIGPALLMSLPQAQHILERPGQDIIPDNALFIDTRPQADFIARHYTGTLSIPISERSFTSYVGWYVNYNAPTFFIAYRNDVQDVLKALFSIGVDNVPGYFTTEVLDGAKSVMSRVTPQQAYDDGIMIIDVRSQSEYQDEHIPNARHIHMGDTERLLDEIPQDTSVVIQCGTGERSGVVTSFLLANGFKNVSNMIGGIDAWKKANLPIES